MTIDPVRWYPVAAADDLPAGHVYQTRLGEHALAIWRDTGGTINVWEDRCPHRGVRLSIGNVVGDELRCQYHSWRFASGSGACTFIPAQPDAKPAAAIRASVWPVAERGGLIWTGRAPESEPPSLGEGEVLRAIPVARRAGDVEAAIPSIDHATFVVQPLEAHRSVIRGISVAGKLREIDATLQALRRRLEAASC